VDWSSYYPAFDSHAVEKAANEKLEELEFSEYSKPGKVPEIVDIGCGFGGLLFALSQHVPDTLSIGES
jgi:tRNA (guanine-N7-)-methyltransferase